MSDREQVPRGTVSGPTHRSTRTDPIAASIRHGGERAGTETRPYRSIVVPSSGAMYLGRGLRQRPQGMGEDRGRDHPQGVRQLRTIPQSRPLAVPAPFTQGSLGPAGRCSADSSRQLTGGSARSGAIAPIPRPAAAAARRRRSRFAARRIAGTSVRGRQLTGGLRPSSLVLPLQRLFAGNAALRRAG